MNRFSKEHFYEKEENKLYGVFTEVSAVQGALCSQGSWECYTCHTVVAEIEGQLGSLHLNHQVNRWELNVWWAGRDVIVAVFGQEESGHSVSHGGSGVRGLTK